MSFEAKDGRYVSVVWFYGAATWDWNCTLWRDTEGPDLRWHMTYRFRYDGKDGADDVRHWYEVMTDEPDEDRAIASGDIAAHEVAAQGANKIKDRIVVKTDRLQTFLDAIRDRPWCTVKPVPGMAEA